MTRYPYEYNIHSSLASIVNRTTKRQKMRMNRMIIEYLIDTIDSYQLGGEFCRVMNFYRNKRVGKRSKRHRIAYPSKIHKYISRLPKREKRAINQYIRQIIIQCYDPPIKGQEVRYDKNKKKIIGINTEKEPY